MPGASPIERIERMQGRGRILGVSGILFAIACGRATPDSGPAPPASVVAPPQTGKGGASTHAAPVGSAIGSATSEKSPFAQTVENVSQPPGSRPAGSTAMVWIPGGEFSMGAFDPDSHGGPGCGDPTADAQPVHRVY